MGGIALRAPVLAALFLIVTLATLAMPGSPNFVGEILILFGALEDKLVFGLIASVGVVLASVYAIRLFQKSMHNRVGPGVGGARPIVARVRGDRPARRRDRRARRLPAARASSRTERQRPRPAQTAGRQQLSRPDGRASQTIRT